MVHGRAEKPLWSLFRQAVAPSRTFSRSSSPSTPCSCSFPDLGSIATPVSLSLGTLTSEEKVVQLSGRLDSRAKGQTLGPRASVVSAQLDSCPLRDCGRGKSLFLCWATVSKLLNLWVTDPHFETEKISPHPPTKLQVVPSCWSQPSTTCWALGRKLRVATPFSFSPAWSTRERHNLAKDSQEATFVHRRLLLEPVLLAATSCWHYYR